MKIRAKPPCGQFGCLRYTYLLEDVSAMILNGSFGNEASCGDFTLACTPRQQFGDFRFPLG